jgi:hypothetical protein
MMRFTTQVDGMLAVNSGREQFAEFIASECRKSALAWWDERGPLDGETPPQFTRRIEGDYFNIEAQETGGQGHAVASVERLRDLQARDEMRPAHEAAFAKAVEGAD